MTAQPQTQTQEKGNKPTFITKQATNKLASRCDDMQELIRQLIAIRDTCQQYGKALESRLGENIIANDPRCGCFAMIFNFSTLNLELIDHYVGFWGRPFMGSEEDAERLREENRQRCIEQTKMLFSGSMSSIEFCAKESIKLHPQSAFGQSIVLLARKKRIYLSDVIKESSNKGLISKQEEDKWDRLIWLRNLLVHNNGVADKDDTYVIDSVTVNLKNGTMIQGNLEIFSSLVESSVELYNSWIGNLEKQP